MSDLRSGLELDSRSDDGVGLKVGVEFGGGLARLKAK